MGFLKTALGLGRIALLWATGGKVGSEDFRRDYDLVAESYDRSWNRLMAAHTLSVLPSNLVERSTKRPGNGFRILDFACGTGVLSEEILKRFAGSGAPDLTCVDISEAMLEACRSKIGPESANFIRSEGMEYLSKLPDGGFDAIFVGWGMVYFSHKPLLRELNRVLVPGGLVGAIMNVAGTLAGVEQVYLETMADHPTAFRKIMDIRFYIPRNLEAWKGWFSEAGFEVLDIAEGEEIVSLPSVEELAAWLRETGAVSGCASLFENPESIEADYLKKLGRRLESNGSWKVNHRFLRGIFEKSHKPVRKRGQ